MLLTSSTNLPAFASRLSRGRTRQLRRPKKPFAVYYGDQQLNKLRAYQTVVLQPQHYTGQELRWLRDQGVRTLAYLSLGEDPHALPGAWARQERNPAWGTWYVKVGHAAWRAQVFESAAAYMQHFDGLFLDTVDNTRLFPADRSPLLKILRTLRLSYPDAYLLVNRGFDLLPEMARHVNGILIESFTTSWLDGYRKLYPSELAYTRDLLVTARSYGLDTYALDYARTPAQRRAAQVRARALGVSTFVSSRELAVL
ncbi:endo alpha-1,4 polygalactosaminidase [Deinococcus ficus]|uniref:Glycoside-hydrolase family GH114 TIM-barrel domain-containing protein n=1 Tax=Deinococcus ficus TaxID=317577 RepID=A0A221T1F5_9DEIO|nr:endo alpha-1,4 polygalactosaminidase [Deinococcus ficus]ASN82719.1 hypothetical protein DFI_16310 [Deinococcus ficus]